MTVHRFSAVIILFLLVTVSASHMSLNSLQTLNAVNSWINSTDDPITEDCTPVLNLLTTYLSHSCVELNACNLFSIRLSLIWTALSIVITYSVVFIELTNSTHTN